MKRKVVSLIFLTTLVYTVCSCTSKISDTSEELVEVWVTNGNKDSLMTNGKSLKFHGDAVGGPRIVIDTTQRFQEIDGFGYALTGGSAYLLHQKVPADQRQALLKELFTTTGTNIGISYLRVSIGASDLDAEVFSYLDLPRGKTDVSLSGFSLAEDEKNVIPILKEILAIYPELKIMGSPWTAPPWMKTNKSFKGGSLKPQYYDAYAKYLVKYIEGMKQAGIPIDAITLQNEPENPNNNPSMVMTAQEQADFVSNNLGPAFKTAGIDTKIVVFDHNADHPEYPIAILDDSVAGKFIDGSAFHLYLGSVDALTKVHEAHPDRNIYFTEQWTSGRGEFRGDLQWHVKNLIIGATRNWSRNVLEWNLAADPTFQPHTSDGGCTECLGALTVGDSIVRNVSYYIIAHASKFVRPGSVRIGSTFSGELQHVAFRDVSGKKVLIVLNETDKDQKFGIQVNTRVADASIAPGTVCTYVW